MITESSSRDGLQSLGAFIPTKAKSGLIDDLAATGITDFDAVSFVSPKWVPQMADGAEVVAGVTAENVTLGGLVPNMKGLENALAAGITNIGVLIAASDTFNERNINATVGRVDAPNTSHHPGDTRNGDSQGLCLDRHPLPL